MVFYYLFLNVSFWTSFLFDIGNANIVNINRVKLIPFILRLVDTFIRKYIGLQMLC